MRIPQIPSSRAFGNAPIYSVNEYLETAPADREDWVTIELATRDIPLSLKQQKPVNPRPYPIPWPVILILFGLSSFVALGLRWIVKKRIS